MKLRETLVLVLAVTVVFSVFSTAGAASIPSWVKGVAGWWSQDKISEQEFLQGIDYLISSGAIKPKIIDEKDAKIKALETELAKYKATGKVVQTYPELRESTKLWADKQITDAVYLRQVQSLVDKGILGPFVTYQDPKYPAADKKIIFEEYRTLAASWANGGYDDGFFIPNLEGLYQAGFLKNPKTAQVAVPEKTESEKIYDEIVSRQAEADSSHLKLLDNAKQWYYGYISTETYMENIITFEKNGIFEPFKTTSQKLRGDVFFTEKALQIISQDKGKIEELRTAVKQFLDGDARNTVDMTNCKQSSSDSVCLSETDITYFKETAMVFSSVL